MGALMMRVFQCHHQLSSRLHGGIAGDKSRFTRVSEDWDSFCDHR
jgi:hypothetical protein